MEVLDGALRATLFAVPTLLRRCLELADNDLMLKLSQELFALGKTETQRRYIADLRTRHLAKRDVGTWPSPSSTARIKSNFMR